MSETWRSRDGGWGSVAPKGHVELRGARVPLTCTVEGSGVPLPPARAPGLLREAVQGRCTGRKRVYEKRSRFFDLGGVYLSVSAFSVSAHATWDILKNAVHAKSREICCSFLLAFDDAVWNM